MQGEGQKAAQENPQGEKLLKQFMGSRSTILLIILGKAVAFLRCFGVRMTVKTNK